MRQFRKYIQIRTENLLTIEFLHVAGYNMTQINKNVNAV